MYILKQGNLIAYASKTEEEINSVKEYMPFDEIIETEDTYILKNGVYLTENEALLKAKEQKHIENTQKAKQAVENGYVTFKNAQFETNAQTVGDLTATMLILQNEQAECEGGADEAATTLQEDTFIASEVNLTAEVSQNETDSSVASLPQNDNKTVILNPTIFEGEESKTDISALPQYDELTYTWLSKDDKAIELTLEDFSTLGNLIAAYKNTIWSEKYIAFKTAIENAKTLEELNEIEIDYGDFDV